MMKIKLQNLDRLYQELQPSLENAVKDVYKSGQHLLGPYTTELEERIANISRAKHCILVGSGSDALYYGLLADSDVINKRIAFPAQTFIATKNSIHRSKNYAQGVDVKPNGLLDWEKVPRDCKKIIWVGLFGNTEGLPTTKTFYEDGAQHFGLGLRGKFASYSFDPTKTLPNFGNAGAVVTNDPDLADRVRQLRRHGYWSKRVFMKEVSFAGGNSLPSERECAELLVKLDHFPFWTERRQEICIDYHALIGNLVECVTQTFGQVSKMVISTPVRDELEAWLAKRGVQTKRVYENPLHNTPQATQNCMTQLALPCDPYMTDQELHYVVLAIKEFFEVFPFKCGC
jgi:dTDP-4-amino-4,6-dideoxygalactose transaminase